MACVNSNDLDGRLAVVAGGSQGTGLATAHRLRATGARVVTIACPPPETADRLFVQADLIQRMAPHESTLAYAAAKGAPAPYSKGSANEVAPQAQGVRVNSVAPGFIRSDGAERLLA